MLLYACWVRLLLWVANISVEVGAREVLNEVEGRCLQLTPLRKMNFSTLHGLVRWFKSGDQVFRLHLAECWQNLKLAKFMGDQRTAN